MYNYACIEMNNVHNATFPLVLHGTIASTRIDENIYNEMNQLVESNCLFVCLNRCFNVGLKTLLSEGLSEPEFYGDLVYKFKKLKGINDFSFQFRKIITRYRRIGYNLNVMRQSACLVFNPIMVDNYAAFFNCTPVGRASDSMMAPT